MRANVAARRIAVLIDADQNGPGILESVLDQAAKEGTVVVLRGYRHWDTETRKGWADARKKHGMEEVEQAAGPNATDMALTIDAVDLMHQRGLDGFVIVSSDKDFAPLAGRLKRGRLRAVLMGDPNKVDAAYRKVWDAFIPLTRATKKTATTRTLAPASEPTTQADGEAREAYREAISAAPKDKDGWVRLSEIGKLVVKELRRRPAAKWLRDNGFCVESRPFDGSGEKTSCVRVATKDRAQKA